MEETIKKEIKMEIFDFKSKMFRKYNKRVYCYYKKNVFINGAADYSRQPCNCT